MIGITFNQGKEIQAVDQETAHGDRSQHAIERQQEEAYHEEAHKTRHQPLLEGLLAERGRDLRLGDQFQLDRQCTGLELIGEVLCRGQGEAAGDLRAVGGVDAVGIARVVDRRRRDDLVVEHHREVLQRGGGSNPRQRRVLAALRDSRVTRWKIGAPLEVKPKVTSGAPAAPEPLSTLCVGCVMSEPLSTGLSLSTYQLSGSAFRTLPVLVSVWAAPVRAPCRG